MRLFTLLRSAEVFQKRLRAVEEALEEIRRMVRSQDLDLSDGLEKMQRLNARLAKRLSTAHSEAVGSVMSDDRQGGSTGDYPPVIGSDAISQRILARRKNRQSTGRTLAEDAGDGVLPGR